MYCKNTIHIYKTDYVLTVYKNTASEFIYFGALQLIKSERRGWRNIIREISLLVRFIFRPQLINSFRVKV